MAVILQILGVVIAFTMAMEGLRRLGIDVGWLNPISWWRRRSWRQKLQTPPLYALEHPVDVVGVMAVATVQTTGVVTAEQKAGVLALLREHLSLDETAAHNLWLASAHMLRSHVLKPHEVASVLAPSAQKFTPYHQTTLLSVMRSAAALDPGAAQAAQALLDAVAAFFDRTQQAAAKW